MWYTGEELSVSCLLTCLTQVVRVGPRLPLLPPLPVPEAVGGGGLVEVLPLPHQLVPRLGHPPLHFRGRPRHEALEEGGGQTETDRQLCGVELRQQ